MAIYFELAAEVGGNENAAGEFSRYFSNLTYTFPDGRSCHTPINPLIKKDREGNWWSVITLSGANITGRGDTLVETDDDLTSLGLFLYDRLRTAPPFRFAYIGYEVEEFRTYSELIDNGEPDLPNNGVVISSEIYEYLNKPPDFLPFAPGYFWIPWQDAHW